MTFLPFKSAVLLVGFASAAAANPFEPGTDCQGTLTVQTRGCVVLNFWQCQGEPDGTVWQSVHGELGPEWTLKTDAEYQWLQTIRPDGTVERLVEPVPDPISLSELSRTGFDRYDFTLSSDGPEGQQIFQVRGQDRIGDEEVVIDGVPLLIDTYSNMTTDQNGVLVSAAFGQQFFSPDLGLFFFGIDTVSAPSGTSEYMNTPVDFIYPDEPGFGATTPVLDCQTKTGNAKSGSNTGNDL